MRIKWSSVLAVFLGVTVMSVGAAGIDMSSWTRGFEDNSDIYTRPFRSFVLLSVSSIEGHLVAGAVFMNPKESLVALEGTERADGKFWVNITAQVANNVGGKWKSVGGFSNKTTILTVPARAVSKTFNVDMDPFRPMIGKFKYGRVLLERGEAAIFELENLLPPKIQR